MNRLKHPKKPKKPPTREMKGLQFVMGGIFLSAARLMVAGGLSSLMLIIAALFFGIGMLRWAKREPSCRYGAALSLVLLLGAIAEIWGYTVLEPTDLSLGIHAVLTVLGTLAAIGIALLIFRTVSGFCEEMSAADTAAILRQRQWWIGIGYAVCGGWVLIDLLTGFMPNVGVILRIVSILLDVFFLSALFQVRKLLE